MKLLLNLIKEEARKRIEAFGVAEDDVTYTTDENGNEVMVLSEEVACKLMQVLTSRMIEEGIKTEECAQNYLEHKSEI